MICKYVTDEGKILFKKCENVSIKSDYIIFESKKGLPGDILSRACIKDLCFDNVNLDFQSQKGE